jgi:hypothetical protein
MRGFKFAIASILVTAAFATPVVERQTPPSLAVIFANLATVIGPLSDQLREYRALL